MRRTTLQILIFSFTLLFACCKDKTPTKTYCEENPGNCSNIQGVKDYFVFKEGTWWVYEEENSGDRDSVYVTESINNTSNYDFDLRVYSTYQGYFYHYFPSYSSGSSACVPSGNINTSCIRVKRSKYKPGDFVAEDNCFMFIFKKGMYSYTYAANTQQEGNRIIIEEVYPTYTHNLFEFGTTVKIHELFTHVENQQATNHYFSKNVGLIRKDLLDSNQVWNLVNYHIEP